MVTASVARQIAAHIAHAAFGPEPRQRRPMTAMHDPAKIGSLPDQRESRDDAIATNGAIA